MDSENYLENFQTLLNWLDSDPEKSAERYGHIHKSLIKIFLSAGCLNPEELADETIDRVAAQIKKLKDYEGEKIKYFLGVARNVKREQFRKKEVFIEIGDLQISSNENETDDFNDERVEKLKICLKKLGKYDRKLIIDYHNVPNSVKKKDFHNKIAEKNLLTVNTLRVQIFRLKQKLFDCVKKALN